MEACDCCFRIGVQFAFENNIICYFNCVKNNTHIVTLLRLSRPFQQEADTQLHDNCSCNRLPDDGVMSVNFRDSRIMLLLTPPSLLQGLYAKVDKLYQYNIANDTPRKQARLDEIHPACGMGEWPLPEMLSVKQKECGTKLSF